MNRLSKETSPYLSHSANQKIDWYPWSAEAFEKALAEDKPVFLSSGAVWCHWCHVMAKECFENEEIVRLLNENFVSIKLDRDEHPDIDRRYQNAVAVMGFGGGWPLSVFLTPDKIPFFGGTYFPPEDSLGRAGFKKVLKAVADFYHTKRGKIAESGRKLIDSLKPKPLTGGEIQESMINDAVTNILSRFDTNNGGFGSSPKFPMPGAVQLLIHRYYFTRMESFGYIVRKTLEAMAKGGFHDQIGGGFHRYSVDEAWIVPHFEKMADDNAWLLRNYLDAYAVSGYEYFREIAKGTIHFLSNVLADPEGGFYASQDADVTPEDEGGYFTWTDEDFKRVLNEEEYKVLNLHLFHERGSMHHDGSKKVLFVSMEADEIAKKLGIDERTVSGRIDSGKKKLLLERNNRESPFIDKTLYTSLNGMLITSFLKAFRVFKDEDLKEFALKSLRKILKRRYMNGELFHTDHVKAVLDDYVYLIEALIGAYEITGDSSYLNQAETLMGLCLEKFWEKDGGFFDTESEVLGIRLKSIEDIPHPSANSLGIILLLKLHSMTDEKKYHDYAETALKIFSLQAKDMGIHSGYYFCAMDAYFHMLKVTLQASPLSKLAEITLSSFYPSLGILYGEDRGRVIPCVKDTCFPPIDTPEGIKEFFENRQQ
jgi:uncharacterized protein YyaL (SSP411 family)